MIGVAMTASRFGLAAFSGTDALVDATAQFAVKLALSSREADLAAAERVVEEMRGLVPQDTGRLFGGITFEADENGTVLITASAEAASGRELDYASFVEHGTVHTEAQPYFYGPAEAALAARGDALDAAIGRAAAEDFR